MAVQAGGVEGGPIVIPLVLRPRVSTQPGTMGKDNDAQRRAARLDDAPSQASPHTGAGPAGASLQHAPPGTGHAVLRAVGTDRRYCTVASEMTYILIITHGFSYLILTRTKRVTNLEGRGCA